MKNYALLFLFALICCKSESKSPNDTTVSNNIANSENVSDATTSANNSNPRTYSIQGTSSSKKGENSKKNGSNFSQNLSIQWISDTTIQYTLTFNSGACNKTVGGRATMVKANKEPFAISHNGKSLEVDKYKDKKEGFDIILQIDSQSKDKAAVNLVFTEDDGNENCTPESAVMLEKK